MIYAKSRNSFSEHNRNMFLRSIGNVFNKTVLLISISVLFCSSLPGQMLQDSASVKLIKTGIDFIYNFEFNKASRIKDNLQQKYPGHPITFLYRGMITYWENYPLTPSSEATASFESDMRHCIDLCDKNKNTAYEAEMLLTNLCARGFLLLYFTENNLSFEVFPIASGTYQCIRRSFEFTSVYRDLFFFTGIYNYYREAYPEAHPVYKTLAFLFPKGNKERGLAELQLVAGNSILMKAEAFTFLNDIYLSFENDFKKATFYSKGLHSLYPDNTNFKVRYITNLLLIKDYDEAERALMSRTYTENDFSKAQISILKGILQEKKYHNLQEAEHLYTLGIREIAPFRDLGDEYTAYGYFGLSRIAEKKGVDSESKNYRRLAMKIATIRKITFDE
jgi:hypothetical protein